MNLVIIFIRNIFFYICITLYFIPETIFGNIYALFANPKQVTKYLVNRAEVFRRILCFCIGIKVVIEGKENLIKGGCIVASKHQSTFETTIYYNKFYPDLAYAFKKEIGNILPWRLLYNKYKKLAVEIDRKHGAKTFFFLEKRVQEIINEGRQFAIFPEGTRVPIGKEIPFKKGIAKIYSLLNVPVIPVALTSGVCWPKGSLLFYPGVIKIKFLKPIPPNLSEEEFLSKLQQVINKESANLLKEIPCNYYMKKQGMC